MTCLLPNCLMQLFKAITPWIIVMVSIQMLDAQINPVYQEVDQVLWMVDDLDSVMKG